METARTLKQPPLLLIAIFHFGKTQLFLPSGFDAGFDQFYIPHSVYSS